MREFWYMKKDPTPGQFGDIETFFSAVYQAVKKGDGGYDNVVMLEMQPNDGTRYRLYVSKPALDDEATESRIIVSMIVPRFCVVELNLWGPRPTVYDEPMCDLNEYTGAILADVLSCLWNEAERAYEYDAEPRPAPKSVLEHMRRHAGAAAPAVEMAPPAE